MDICGLQALLACFHSATQARVLTVGRGSDVFFDPSSHTEFGLRYLVV